MLVQNGFKLYFWMALFMCFPKYKFHLIPLRSEIQTDDVIMTLLFNISRVLPFFQWRIEEYIS